jgi:anti-sigma B factor antagonist
VALVGLSEEIKDTMSMTGFLNFFRVAETLEAAKLALA